MTIKELSQLFFLRREIETLQDQLQTIRADIDVCKRQLAERRRDAYSGGLGSPEISDMPKGPHRDGSPTEDAALSVVRAEEQLQEKLRACVDLENRISDRQARCVSERLKLEAFIDGVTEPMIRLAMTYRFVNGFSWNETAAAIGGRVKGESVRRSVNRYVDEH